MTRLAEWRLMPNDPALVDIKVHFTLLFRGSLNLSTIFCLSELSVLPSSLSRKKYLMITFSFIFFLTRNSFSVSNENNKNVQGYKPSKGVNEKQPKRRKQIKCILCLLPPSPSKFFVWFGMLLYFQPSHYVFCLRFEFFFFYLFLCILSISLFVLEIHIHKCLG